MFKIGHKINVSKEERIRNKYAKNYATIRVRDHIGKVMSALPIMIEEVSNKFNKDIEIKAELFVISREDYYETLKVLWGIKNTTESNFTFNEIDNLIKILTTEDNLKEEKK